MPKHLSKIALLLLLSLFVIFKNDIFASDEVINTTLTIRNNIVSIIHQPDFATGFWTNGPVLAHIT